MYSDQLEQNKTYRISFSYKNLSGKGLSYALLQDEKLITSSNGVLDNSNEWKKTELYFTPINNYPVKLYFYMDSYGEKSESLIDAINLELINEIKSFNLKLKSYSPDYKVENYKLVDTTGIK